MSKTADAIKAREDARKANGATGRPTRGTSGTGGRRTPQRAPEVPPVGSEKKSEAGMGDKGEA